MSAATNIYKEEVDFVALGNEDPDFGKLLKSNGQLDFSDPKSVQQLTKSLLKRDFSLNLTLPDDRLCPPVPNRLNYILWLQELIDTSSDVYNDCYNSNRQVHGLDIGTGASCIYPLLGCAQRASWRFTGTDIDDRSIAFARTNVQNNGLQTRIQLIQTKSKGPLIPLDQIACHSLDFTLCNPPFYTSAEDLISSASLKQRPPFTACTGSETEMVCEGGEVSFVSRMIVESLQLRNEVQWYTSMLGKFSSLSKVIEQLKKYKIDNYAVTEFIQGSRTRRWAVAWSFNDRRPSIAVSRGCKSLPKSLLPFPTEQTITGSISDKAFIATRLHDMLSKLIALWSWESARFVGTGFCEKAVWSRASRRHLSETNDEKSNVTPKGLPEDMAFGFRISFGDHEEESPGTKVVIRWLKGHDSVLFESFCGMIKRKLQDM
ncbi:uncharacterized protein EAF01_006309 [Botrytis porri]|uniref:U6 small nuclear RNA (adenine-(43)-N(6))-methyltransferase n=1 Tax=Botrytis porri TaxID=87229 RepID=A0A4Z1K9N9_9HELO|nr:uncharacterized protein EAF01_006309 [Botrytis porri]KAF7903260.1 hypothetical protein EAF01_006309 [Botrytis porri]TGO82168.1 hypothetical protein BPOR_0901g00030 [Botrytis porri]